MLRLTQLFNVTGHPAITLPCGDTAAGLPCGLQLVGRRHETDALVRTALAVEAGVARHERSAKAFALRRANRRRSAAPVRPARRLNVGRTRRRRNIRRRHRLDVRRRLVDRIRRPRKVGLRWLFDHADGFATLLPANLPAFYV